MHTLPFAGRDTKTCMWPFHTPSWNTVASPMETQSMTCRTNVGIPRTILFAFKMTHVLNNNPTAHCVYTQASKVLCSLKVRGIGGSQPGEMDAILWWVKAFSTRRGKAANHFTIPINT